MNDGALGWKGFADGMKGAAVGVNEAGVKGAADGLNSPFGTNGLNSGADICGAADPAVAGVKEFGVKLLLGLKERLGVSTFAATCLM